MVMMVMKHKLTDLVFTLHTNMCCVIMGVVELE